MESEIFSLFKELVKEWKISKEEKREAIKILRSVVPVFNGKDKFYTSFPCMYCCQPHTFKPGEILIRHGNGWLENVFTQAKERRKNPNSFLDFVDMSSFFPYIEKRYKRGKEIFEVYTCESCQQTLLKVQKERYSKKSKELDEERELKKQNKNKEIIKIISGETKTTITNRFKTLIKISTEKYLNDLSKMKYKDFLKTDYWNIIRSYLLFLNNYKCSLCNSNGKLNVHHKTYEFRGREILDLDKSLIVLCENCHAKFHDKEN